MVATGGPSPHGASRAVQCISDRNCTDQVSGHFRLRSVISIPLGQGNCSRTVRGLVASLSLPHVRPLGGPRIITPPWGVLPADDPEVGRPSIGSDRGPERSPFGPVSGRWGTGSADTPTGVGCAAGLGGDHLGALGLLEVGCLQMGSWLRAGADGSG